MKEIVMNKRIILALGMIVFVAAVVISSTGAFFSDSESSVGNVFTAGAIDLKIDSNATYNGQAVTSATWAQKDLVPTADKFFNFTDVKPGDKGENTISVHVISNDAWVCAEVSNLTNDDNGINEPESTVDSTDGVGNGELKDSMNWVVWRDDGAGGGTAGDNIQNGSEQTLTSGHPNNGVLALYDSTTGTGPLTSTSTGYIGVAWELPATVGNEVQTDSMTGDVSFSAVQSRNNEGYKCGETATNGPDLIGNDDIAYSPTDLQANPTKWFFYNDTNDSIMSLNQFSGTGGANEIVTGPVSTDAAFIKLGTEATPRYNIATYKFKDVKLSTITSLAYRAYDTTIDSDSPFMNFNIDFNNSDTWQSRLVYVPGASTNPALTIGSWKTVDTIQGGSGMWTWSRFAKGPDDIASTADDNTWPDGNTNQYRSWSDLMTAFPNAETRSTDSWFGIRVGQPGPTGAVGYVDWVEFDGVKYDFGN